MDKQDEHLLLDFLKSQKLMTLATYGNHPWSATVYYIHDDDFNLYFLSSPSTLHCQQIKGNPNVACAIYDSHQKVTDEKIGLYIHGQAKHVDSMEKIKWMFKMYNQTNLGVEKILNFQNFQGKAISAQVYQVTPQRIKMFNEVMFGEEGKVWEL